MWGDFLNILSPSYVKGYEKVAVLLDDLALPPEAGAVERMVVEMSTHGLDVFSPAILGAHKNRRPRREKNA